MSFLVTLTVNRACYRVVLEDERTTLLDLLREHLELTGTKKGCDAVNAALARCSSINAG
jgi:xanthine dehydrogenase YagT iron-sulfur-binding subunit